MNKGELIDSIAESADLTKADAARALDGVVDSITQALKDGDTVTIIGFGSFMVRDRAARTGRNPKTGEAIQIKASKSPALFRFLTFVVQPARSLKYAEIGAGVRPLFK